MDYAYDHGIPYSQFLAWPDADQDRVLAAAEIRGERCGGCNLTDTEAIRFRASHEPDLHRCPVCEAADLLLAEVADGEGSKHGLHLRWYPSAHPDDPTLIEERYGYA